MGMSLYHTKKIEKRSKKFGENAMTTSMKCVQAIVFTSKHIIFTTEKLFALVALKIDDFIFT